MIYDFAHILCSHLQTERHGWRLDWWCSCEWTWVYSVIAMKLWFTRQPSDTKRIWNVVVLGLKVKVWFYIAFYLVVPTQFNIPFILVDCCVWGWVWVVQQASWCVQIFICSHTVHNTWRWLEQIHHHNQNSNNSSGLDISNHSLEETSNKTGSWGVCANVCNPITQLGSSGCIAPNFTQQMHKTSWCTSCALRFTNIQQNNSLRESYSIGVLRMSIYTKLHPKELLRKCYLSIIVYGSISVQAKQGLEGILFISIHVD